MADHHLCDSTLVEEREDEMHPPAGGNPTLRNAHFLKPIFKDHHSLPPLPSSNQPMKKLKKCEFTTFKEQPSEKWKIWVERLKPKYQETWKQAGIYEAILASTYAVPKDKNLIIGLAERWCAETNTFVFPWGEVSITLEDVIFLGNYSVLGDSFLTPLAGELAYIYNCLKEVHVKAGSETERKVCGSVWMKYNMGTDSPIEHEAFLAMWLSRFVFVCSHDYIDVTNFPVAIHLSRGNRIALAPVVLASIYRDMRPLHSSIDKSVVNLTFSVYHYDLVQMWAWERFPELRPTPSVMEKGEPRWVRWIGARILNVEDVEEVLDSGKESFVWRPYSINPSNCVLSNLYKDSEQWLVVESDDQESFARCLRVSELVGKGYIEQYSPQRLAMQFGLDQDIPAYVIPSGQSSETAWICYNRSVRGMKLYIPPRQFESDISSRYVYWWRGLPVVNEEVVTNCIQNVKHLPHDSYQQKKDANFLTSPSCVSDCAAESLEDSLAKDQLMSCSRMTESSGRKNDHEPVLQSFSKTGTLTEVICTTELVGHTMAVNEETVTQGVQNEKHSPFVSRSNTCREKAQVPPRPKEVHPWSKPKKFGEIKFPRSLRLFCLYKASLKRTRFGPKEVKDLIDLSLSNNEMGSCDSTSDNSMTEPVGHTMVVNEETVSGGIHNEKHSPLVSCGDKRDTKSLTTPGCLSGCAEERQEDDEEDGLTIAQVLIGSRKTKNGTERNDKKSKCTNESMEFSKQSTSSSSKCKKTKSSTEKPTDLEDAFVSKANHHEVNNNKIALENVEAVNEASCPEYYIVNTEEESSGNTSELPQLGLKARIWRLEKIFDFVTCNGLIT